MFLLYFENSWDFGFRIQFLRIEANIPTTLFRKFQQIIFRYQDKLKRKILWVEVLFNMHYVNPCVKWSGKQEILFSVFLLHRQHGVFVIDSS